jgi:hypothetical protein
MYRWVGIAFLLLWAFLGLAGGCFSSSLPPRLSREEQARVTGTHFRWAVGVERYHLPAYSNDLIKALRATQLFDRVDELEKVPDAPMVARVETEVWGTAVIPVWTGLSLGLIPTVTREQHGYVFSLAPRSNPGKVVSVDFRYSGISMMGWLAVLHNLGPNTTWKNVDEHPRFHAALANAVCARASELRAIVE